jgi:endo-1,4-beta-xylanase
MRHSLLFVILLCWVLSACTFGIPDSDSTPLPYPAAVTPSREPASPKSIFPSCNPVVIPYDSTGPGDSPSPALDAGPSLRSLAEKRGLRIGAAVFPEGLNDPAYAHLLAQEFNLLIPETVMRLKYVQPEPGRFDFSQADSLVAFAQANHMEVYGHVLVWDGDLPAWITEHSFTRDEMIQLLCTHIKTVVNHYRGQIYAWIVVNEAFDDNGQLRDTLYMHSIGPDYIAMAFQWANEADPSAILVLNETFAEGMNRKSQAVYALAQGLLARDIPIHAIGLQMHVILGGRPTSDELLANLQRITALGLDAHITEMDIRTQYSPDPPQVIATQEAETYRQALAACLQVPGCRVFATWGLTDRYSWIKWLTGHPDAPLLFDQNFQPKPAYFALLDLLKQ